ncbi:MAG: prepilin-type N-terminal cleavage/methylation domain-containing protein [Candidatus Omnitrophica bacterium]|nr:prepilin-type N-terminal cleavage/methylation domain-containing protein [Candidatus Omnitrophota bacterium]
MKGFTLVESVITVAIFSLIFAALFAFMNQGLIGWHIAEANIELQQDTRRALLIMSRQLRQSRSSAVSVPADDNYYTNITFRMPEDVDLDGDVIDSLGGIEWSGDISYAVNVSKQLARTSPSGTLILANNITALTFKRFSGNVDVIQINITALKTTVSDKTAQVDIEGLVKMRN